MTIKLFIGDPVDEPIFNPDPVNTELDSNIRANERPDPNTDDLRDKCNIEPHSNS